MDNNILSSEEMAYFEKWGYVRVSQALSEAFVEKSRAVIWRETELIGEPGDAILCHPALFHATSRNASAMPRIMWRTNVRRQKK